MTSTPNPITQFPINTVPVSGLDNVTLSTVDGGDHFIINDNEGASSKTNKIEIGEFIGYIEAQDLTFTGDITFINDTYFGGSILPVPNQKLTIVVDDITIRQELNVEDFAVVTGLELNDLEDVDYDTLNIQEGDSLIWDSTNEVFVNGTIDSSPVYVVLPLDPKPGDLWWRKENGKLYVYYYSVLSGFSQWVQASGNFIDRDSITI